MSLRFPCLTLGSVWFESFGGEGRGENIFNLKCLVQFLEGEGRGANFIALPKLSLN
ncbi:hypothetical protein MTR_2g062260 [Medicago truncatula]|uniref:Uncharacterized protein n=1 Tax=Medicago truncatula TaxID=3880 RepID=G7IQN1_MEDTR|nr:hypothetical protein MTR_2g062260 [Medicago truncatula]